MCFSDRGMLIDNNPAPSQIKLTPLIFWEGESNFDLVLPANYNNYQLSSIISHLYPRARKPQVDQRLQIDKAIAN